MMNKQNDAQRNASVKSPVNRRVWIALGALCIASFLGHLALFPQLPDIVPTHWDAAGNVNGWSSRMATLGLDLLHVVGDELDRIRKDVIRIGAL